MGRALLDGEVVHLEVVQHSLMLGWLGYVV